MWELDCEEAECSRIEAFELRWWIGLLRVPWTARKSNMSILKEISPGCSLEGLMLKLKLQYFAHSCEVLTHWEKPRCWEGMGSRQEEDYRGWKAGWHHRIDRHELEWTLGGQGALVCCNSWGCKESMINDQLNLTELNWERRKYMKQSVVLGKKKKKRSKPGKGLMWQW